MSLMGIVTLVLVALIILSLLFVLFKAFILLLPVAVIASTSGPRPRKKARNVTTKDIDK